MEWRSVCLRVSTPAYCPGKKQYGSGLCRLGRDGCGYRECTLISVKRTPPISSPISVHGSVASRPRSIGMCASSPHGGRAEGSFAQVPIHVNMPLHSEAVQGHAKNVRRNIPPEVESVDYGVTMLPSPSPLGLPSPSLTSTRSMSKMSLRPASGWLASIVTLSSPSAVMSTGTVCPFSRRS